jgi:hypothetical protein
VTYSSSSSCMPVALQNYQSVEMDWSRTEWEVVMWLQSMKIGCWDVGESEGEVGDENGVE